LSEQRLNERSGDGGAEEGHGWEVEDKKKKERGRCGWRMKGKGRKVKLNFQAS